MSTVVSFAEESCWDGERFRSVRREIVFVVAGHAIQTGKMIRHEFRSDFGIFYDVDDDLLIQILREELPAVDWGWFVYHKKLDHSGISIINPDNGKVVGSIYPRGRTRQKLSGDDGSGKVTLISKGVEYRVQRQLRELEKAKKRTIKRPLPEDS